MLLLHSIRVQSSEIHLILQATDKELYQDIKRKTEGEMQALVQKIQKEIDAALLPKVPHQTLLLEGLAEEEIISYSRKTRPMAIVMGNAERMPKNSI